MENYTKIQAKIGTPGARFNQLNQEWHPKIGGAVNFAVSYQNSDEAVCQASLDLKNNNLNSYE